MKKIMIIAIGAIVAFGVFVFVGNTVGRHVEVVSHECEIVDQQRVCTFIYD